MVKICGQEWYEDKGFLNNLNIWLDAIDENDDLVLVVDGPERAGKSSRLRQIAMYCAYYLGTSFNDNNIHFKVQDYMDFSIDSPPKTVCVLDEARKELNKKRSNSKAAVKFTDFLSECGMFNQVHIIALPAYHDLDKYIIDWRSKGVYHIHKEYEQDSTKRSGYKLKRGDFTFWINDDYLKKSYLFPYSYPKRWTCRGRFANHEVLTKEQLQNYENKKGDNIEKKYHSKSEEAELAGMEKRWCTRAINLAEHCELSRGLTRGEIADAMKMELQNYQKFVQRYGQKTNK